MHCARFAENVWRLDNNILLNKDVVKRIQVELETFFADNMNTIDKSLLGDTFKAYARSVCISQKVYLNKKGKTRLDEKLMEIKELERQFENTKNKDIKNVVVENEHCKNVKILHRQHRKLCMHDRTFSNIVNKQLARILAETREQKTLVGKMVDKDGKVIDDLKGRLHIFSTYYTYLFKSLELSLEDIQSFLDRTELPCLSEQHRKHLDVGITYLDIEKAILWMKLEKTPGLDGLTVEFYKTFREDVIL